MLNNPLDLSNLSKLSNMKIFHNLPKLDFGGFALLEYLLSYKPYKKKGIKFFLNTFNSLYLFDSKNKELSNTNDDYILLEI